MIGADKLVYQDLADLVDTCKEGNPEVVAFDCSVFDGKYLAGNIDDNYLQRLEQSRSDAAKAQRNKDRAQALADNEVMDLHNAS